MVSNSALAAVCVWSGLQEHLLLESYHLASSIQVYADQLKDKQAAEYEAAERDGRSPGQYWLEIEPPKVSEPFHLWIRIINYYSVGTLRCSRIRHRRYLHFRQLLPRWRRSTLRQRPETILRPACDSEDTFASPN
jgi:hypothetical protein